MLHTVTVGTIALQRDKFAWRVPLAAAIAVTLMIAGFLAVGWADKTLPLAAASLFIPISGTYDPPNRRLITQLWTLLWLMLATLLGGLLSSDFQFTMIAGVLVGAALAFVCGFVGGAGPNARTSGMLSLVLFAIFLGMPVARDSAVADSLLVGLGGILVMGWVIVLRAAFKRPPMWGASKRAPSVIAQLRPRFNPRDDFFRHGVRLAGSFTTATIIAECVKWPHQYWIPMTVAWASVPDLSGTATRIAARILGTIIGIAVVTAVIELGHLGPYQTAVLIGFGALITMMFIAANYMIAVAGVTVFLIALFTLIGEPVGTSEVYRILATILGGAITIVWSLVWMSTTHEHRHRFFRSANRENV
jgi:hypothetical protein